jgi:hypothetical protein
MTQLVVSMPTSIPASTPLLTYIPSRETHPRAEFLHSGYSFPQTVGTYTHLLRTLYGDITDRRRLPDRPHPEISAGRRLGAGDQPKVTEKPRPV